MSIFTYSILSSLNNIDNINCNVGNVITFAMLTKCQHGCLSMIESSAVIIQLAFEMSDKALVGCRWQTQIKSHIKHSIALQYKLSPVIKYIYKCVFIESFTISLNLAMFFVYPSNTSRGKSESHPL